MAALAQWWHEGESGAAAVYRQSFVGFVATFAGSTAILSALPIFRTWYCILICVGVTLRTLMERRRAFIFGDSFVTYRPAFGAPLRVEFAQVVGIETCAAPVPFLWRPRLYKGLRLHLRHGDHAILPLDFPRSNEISARLFTAVSH